MAMAFTFAAEPLWRFSAVHSGPGPHFTAKNDSSLRNGIASKEFLSLANSLFLLVTEMRQRAGPSRGSLRETLLFKNVLGEEKDVVPELYFLDDRR
jgi:hypothetical protein